MLHIMSMFRSEAEQQTRFEASEELQPVAKLLTELRKKETELNRAKRSRGAESVDFSKYTIVSRLLNALDELIDAFNAVPQRLRREDEVEDMIQLLSGMEDLVRVTIARDKETLKQFRDFQRATVAKAVDWGLFLTSVGAVYMMPVGWLLRCGIYFVGAKPLKNSIMDKTGLTEDEARTMIILRGLRTTLHRSYLNLRRTVHPELADPAALRRAAHLNNNNNDDENDEREESGLLFLLSPAMQEYVESFRDRRLNSEVVEEMQLTADEEGRFRDYLDPITLMVMDVPVRLEEDLFDLNSLLKLQIDRDGARTNPLNRHKFYARDIQPCRNANNAIQEIITSIRAQRQQPAAPHP